MTVQDFDAKSICHSCIGDQFLAEQVKTEATPALCSYCGAVRESITLDALADRIHDALQEHFELTPGYPIEPYEYMMAGEGKWDRKGVPVEFVIAEMGGLEEDVAGDVTSLLSGGDGYWAGREEGREGPYGSEAMYEPREPNDSGFRYTWEVFRHEIRSRSRFFSAASEEMLRFIFGDLNTHIGSNDRSVVREINPGDHDAFIWRARTAQSTEELEAILKSPSSELGPPLSRFASAGRMNPQGIPVFYGSMEKPTCVSELRAPVGSHVAIGRFRLLRPIKLLDLDVLANVYTKERVP